MRAQIHYRQFWDVPRCFVTTYKDSSFLLECDFDEELDDYPESYHVYRLSKKYGEEIDWPWCFANRELVGQTRVTGVKFDETRRQYVDVDFLSKFE
jgi:hypothetical protein